jgi:hypothetical protein
LMFGAHAVMVLACDNFLEVEPRIPPAALRTHQRVPGIEQQTLQHQTPPLNTRPDPTDILDSVGV